MKLPKIYEPGEYENQIYELWENSGAFKPNGKSGTFSIVMPPPNANADLHIGYELTAALEDIAARYHRMKGEATLLLPGADHAGFETWVVYEKKLAKEGKSRFDYTRDELYQQVWDFVAQNRQNFESQLRKMGASCDWSRFTFTLDNKIVNTTYKTFKKMWDEGLIYRGERLVNFCTFHGTAFADIEVEYKEERGSLWFIRYPLVDKSDEIIVATTRPETMLGDTAVAVNPNDKRYKNLIGKTVRLPLANREVPIIVDEFVDPKFGTGAVKITPAHDPNDFEAGQRHNLPMISVINHEGKMIDVPEVYRGLTVEEARQKIVDDLANQGSLAESQKYTHSVGHCYKCGTVIQPLLREQWFVDMQPLAKKAIKSLEAGEITFFPAAKKNQLITYLTGLKDWNISRQIAWGIPIPAFQNVDESDDWIYDERVEQEIIEVAGKTYHRDPDVFDTWFSSSSWPYATLDFPNGENFKKFYPLSLMETGGEILYPWVSRMVMLGLYVTGKVPFEAVYIHGYVMAEDGTKMSKSIGNVIDPMPMIEKYGSDALRMGIISGRVPAVNRGYDQRKVEDARNFCNKLWNVARYIEDKVDIQAVRDSVEPKTIADHWVLVKLQKATDKISTDLDNYRFAEAYETLYHFIWDDFADWYVEASKIKPNLGLLTQTFKSILKIAHPFAPFVTETIWQTLSGQPNSLLITSHWPEVPAADSKQAKHFEQVKAIITEVRNLFASLRLTGQQKLEYKDSVVITDNVDFVEKLAKVKVSVVSKTGKGLRLTQTDNEIWLAVGEKTIQHYQEEVADRLKTYKATIKQLKARLANENYIDKAPKEIVKQTKQQLAEVDAKLKIIEQERQRFSKV